ncbi:hypothetical protein LguiB_003249 [Lonicera macranthoides]
MNLIMGNIMQYMQQKIVIKVQMKCEECRTKAMKIAAVAEGILFNLYVYIIEPFISSTHLCQFCFRRAPN